jgi:ribonuclease III
MKILKKIFTKKTPRRSVADGIFFDNMKKIIGFEPKNLEHYKKTFTHRSSNKIDDSGFQISYERLEYLGDSVLSTVIATHLYNEVPNGDEGYLTKMRSKIVSRQHLNELGKDLELLKFVETRVSKKSFGENIYGNIFEALVGAIYLDLGFAACERFIHNKVIIPYVDIPKLEGKVISYKSLMIEWCQKQKKQIEFDTFSDNHIRGDKLFAVHLKIDDVVISKSRDTSKKRAEEKASQRAFFVLQNKIENKKK